MTSTTRGPLPPAVYWRRRAFVIGLAFALVLVLVGLVRGGDHGAPSEHAATTTGAVTDPTPTPSADRTRQPQPTAGVRGADAADRNPSTDQATAPPVLAEPEGTCSDDDVSVTPSVDTAVGLQPVTIHLTLRTLTAAACTWGVSPRHLAVKITDGSTLVWTSLQCPFQLPRVQAVVRRDVESVVDMTWSPRRSEDGCPHRTDWVVPGDYTVTAAALGGEPASGTFDLTEPQRQVITLPPRGTKGAKGSKGSTQH